MQESNLIIIALFFLIILLGACFGLGYYFGQKKSVEPPTCPSSLLDSKMLQMWSVFARGEVKEISNRNLTLSSNSETLKIFVPHGTRIQALTDQGATIMSFEDIKIGSKLEIKVWIPQEKTPLTATLVTILP